MLQVMQDSVGVELNYQVSFFFTYFKQSFKKSAEIASHMENRKHAYHRQGLMYILVCYDTGLIWLRLPTAGHSALKGST